MERDQPNPEISATEPDYEVPAGLIMLIGPPGAGKTTFCEELVAQGKVDSGAPLSSDSICVELFGDTQNREERDPQIFAELDRRIQLRLRSGQFAIVDATNVKPEARERLIRFAEEAKVPVTALKFTAHDDTLLAQNTTRDRNEDEALIREYAGHMRATASDQRLLLEGVDKIIAVPGQNEGVDAASAAAKFNFVNKQRDEQ